MAIQTVFKRYELKYLMTGEQRDLLLKIMAGHMALDKYGHTTIRNIYFDTVNYRLVRHSIEGPPYKEKLQPRIGKRQCIRGAQEKIQVSRIQEKTGSSA